MWTTKLLVVANRTVDSDELHAALKARADAGPIRVTLLVPQDSQGGQGRRLGAALERLHDAGIDAEGMLGDMDPAVAVMEAWDPRRWDEIIVVTLPSGASKWLAFAVPHRIAKITDVPVIHIEAQEPRAHVRLPLRQGQPTRSWQGSFVRAFWGDSESRGSRAP
jgi:hypothetical protein